MHGKASPVFQFIKLIFACFLGVLFLIFSAIMLRHICIPTAQASEKNYLLIQEPTPLYSSSTLETPFITLPEGFYAEVLSKTDTLIKVQYNSVTGFIKLNSSSVFTTSPTAPIFQTAEIKTKADAGTYLRTAPTATSTHTAIVTPNTNLIYIGEISGERPNDGTSPNWFYVHYIMSDTIIHSGYVYSERVEIISGKLDHPVESLPTSTTTPPESKAETTEPIIPTEPLTAGVKIFLGILFSTLGVIIFALLIISPHEKKEPVKRPRVHGQITAQEAIKTTNFDEKTLKNSIKTQKNDNFYIKSGFSTQNPPENHPAEQKKHQSSSKIHTKSGLKSLKIPPETAIEAENMKKSPFNQNSHQESKNSYKTQNTEFGKFHDFASIENKNTITSRPSKNRELLLMGEKNGSMPRALTRYFDIE